MVYKTNRSGRRENRRLSINAMIPAMVDVEGGRRPGPLELDEEEEVSMRTRREGRSNKGEECRRDRLGRREGLSSDRRRGILDRIMPGKLFGAKGEVKKDVLKERRKDIPASVIGFCGSGAGLHVDVATSAAVLEERAC